MGSNDKESGTEEQPMHTVRLSAFRRGKYELTLREFKTFAVFLKKESRPSH
jgi:formylglycine-generating enzyme required for sulfatase activity